MAATEEMKMAGSASGPMVPKRRPSLYRIALIVGFLALTAVFWYLAIKAVAFVGLLASL